MNDYFEREILAMERELTHLKTSSQKSGASLKLVTKSIPISVNLEYKDISYPTGSARAKVYYEIVTGNNSLIAPTLDWYSGNIMEVADTQFKTRSIRMWQVRLPNGSPGILLYFIGTEYGSDSDAARVKRGETVTVSVNLTVCCTNEFTLRRYG